MKYNSFREEVELEEYSIYSTPENGTDGIVVIDSMNFGLLLRNRFLFHLSWNRGSLKYLFSLFLFLKGLKRNAA